MKTSLILLSTLSLVLAAPLPEKLAVKPLYLPMVDTCNGDADLNCPTKRDAAAAAAVGFGKRAVPLYSSVTNEPCIDGHPCPTEKRTPPPLYDSVTDEPCIDGHPCPTEKRTPPALYDSVTDEPCIDGHPCPTEKRNPPPLYDSVTDEPCIDGHPCPTKRDARLATPESYGLTQNIYSSSGHQNPPSKRAAPLYSAATKQPCIDGHPCPAEKRDARLATPESYGLTQNIYSSSGHQNPPSKA